MDLDKASKSVMKLCEKAMALDGRSSRFDDRLSDLSEALQSADVASGEVSFILKFKKLKSGKTLTNENAHDMTKHAATVLADIIDCTKAVRAMMPNADV